ncbi:hypothetical protein N0V90_010639 [Kalmusia sp. IMI 367209]|nr:hypothetical protein N0V90_010639 [Kalmusia sp. IMI 367209]
MSALPCERALCKTTPDARLGIISHDVLQHITHKPDSHPPHKSSVANIRYASMRTQSIFALAFATLATAIPNPQGDTPIDFVISVFETSSTCDASTGAKAVFGTGCQNHTVPVGGSALVRISTASKYGYVTGWTEADCQGEAIIVFTQADGCTDLDREVKSWIGKPPFDENGK